MIPKLPLGFRQVMRAYPDSHDIERDLQRAGLLTKRKMHALQPDIVAAAFWVRVLGQRPEMAPELIWIALDQDLNSGTLRISRLCYDAEIIIGYHQNRLSRWPAGAVDGNLERSKKIEPILAKPQLPLGLQEVGMAAYRTLGSAAMDDTEKARLPNNLSVYLSRLGDRQGAFGAALEAVEIYERLSAQNPAAYEPDLARYWI